MALPVPGLDEEEGTAPVAAPAAVEMVEVLCEENPAEPEGVSKPVGEKVHVTVEVPLPEDWWVKKCLCSKGLVMGFLFKAPPLRAQW